MNKEIVWPGWKTVGLIGHGSFGGVYEIERDVFGTKERAAVKVISIPQSDSEIDEFRSEYEEKSIRTHFEKCMHGIVREYSMMAEMKGCANIVYCDDVKYTRHDDGIGWDIFIKMELLTALSKALGKSKEITDKQVIKIGTDICHALAFCEKRNVLHRDIKPQNILVGPDGTYKLGDFGTAKAAEGTTSGTKVGTYDYMAPEVYNNEPYSLKADICSLGLVLYWLLNDRRTPFLPLRTDPPTATEKEIARAKRFSGAPLPAPAHGSEELKRIVLKACAYDPKDRYRSAEEMRRDLEALNGWASGNLSGEESEEDSSHDDDGGTIDAFHENGGGTIDVSNSGESGGSSQNHKRRKKLNVKKGWLIIPIILLCVAAIGIFAVGGTTKRVSISGQSIACGSDHVVGLKSDGTVVAVGSNLYGRCEVSDWTDIIAIVAGNEHTVGLKADGTVVAVGWNDLYDQCEVSDWSDIVSIARGYCHTVGLKSDGTVVVAGSNECGECDVSDWTDIVTVAAGYFSTYGLKADGTVVAVGSNLYGKCEVSDWTDIVAVASGRAHTVGLKSDGTVVAVGDNEYGQCEVSDWTDIVAVAAAWYHTVGLKSDGTVVAVGWDNHGQCDVSGWANIVELVAGDYNTVGLKSDGSVVFAGSDFNGKGNASDWTDIYVP